MKQPRVSIVILNWNCLKYLKHCIDSVMQQTYKNIELMIIDNGSTDSSVGFIKKEFPEIRIIENHKNLGFAKAHNQGIRVTNSEYYMPLNPDVVLTKNYVAAMVKTIKTEPDIGSVSGKLLLLDHKGIRTKRIYTTGHAFYKDGDVTNIGDGEGDIDQYNEMKEVFGVNGAAPLYKRVMLEDIKYRSGEYFDELFFMYGTDSDLDWRARLRGWKCLYTPEAIGYHVGCGAGGLKQRRIRVGNIQRKYLKVLKNARCRDVFYFYLPLMLKELLIALREKRKDTVLAILEIPFLLFPVVKRRIQIMRRRKVSWDYIRGWFLNNG